MVKKNIEKKLVIAVMLINQKNKFLLQLRDTKPTIFLPGMWGGSGGPVEQGETLLEAAYRKLKEEIEFVPKRLQYLRCYPLADRDSHVFYGRIDTLTSSQFHLHEGQALHFFSVSEIQELYEQGKTVKEVVSMAQETLKKMNG